MSLKLIPARMEGGFVNRYQDHKLKTNQSLYINNLNHWLKQRKLPVIAEVQDGVKGFIKVSDIETWVATPIADGKPEYEPYVTVILAEALDFSKKYKIDIFITE